MSKKSTSIPKNQQRIRDHGFDNYMEVEKKMRKVIKFQELIFSQPQQCVPVSRLDFLARRTGFKRDEAGKFVLKLPEIFEIYEHPVQRILYLRFTRNALLQIDQEKHSLNAQIPDAVTRLRKLLMLSNTGRLHLEHIRIARRDFGLPDDFEYSVVLKYPQYFRLFDAKDSMSKYIELVEKDPRLTVCAVDKVREIEYRKKGIDEENTRFSFVVNFPPGFKIGKYFKIAMWKWQRLPYWSPYEDVSGHDMRSFEAQSRMEKRAVAMIHELLSLTVEKRITLERIARLRVNMDLPKKLKDFLLQYQGIFYISTRGNQGKLHTIFLREAYKKGELIEPNDVYLARRKLAELILVSPRKASLGRELVSYTRHCDDVRGSHREQTSDSGDLRGDRVGGQDLDSDSEVESNSNDEDDDARPVSHTRARR
ncbi:hypothetical protein BVRB_3g066310 [Beta vulgaris subsp. vulgaris]|nr:hypothetical protein BVRB_3g066310 [Beta vulgaris subsp. vulgaris]